MTIFKKRFDVTTLSTEDYLNKHGVNHNSIKSSETITTKLSETITRSTEDYLKEEGLDEFALTARGVELRHRLTSRTIVLWSLVVPMSIVPFFLMGLLSLPAFGNKEAYSERMQYAFMTALAADFVGLYYVVTRDLFPEGKGSRRKGLEPEVDNSDDQE